MKAAQEEEEEVQSIGEDFSSPATLSPPPSPPLALKKEIAARAFAALESGIRQMNLKKAAQKVPTETEVKHCDTAEEELEMEKKKEKPASEKEETEDEESEHESEKKKEWPEVSDRPWCECYQEGTGLASCTATDDILLLLCSEYLALEETIALGMTCRRLHAAYRQALASVQHLSLSHLDVYGDHLHAYETYESRLWSFTRAEEQQQPNLADKSRLRRLQISLQGSQLGVHGDYQLEPSLLLTSGLLSSGQLPRLTSLELTTGHLGTTLFLAHLFGSLNSLTALESLTLSMPCRHWLVDVDGHCRSVKSSRVARGPLLSMEEVAQSDLLEPPCAQLRLPALRQLTLECSGIRLAEQMRGRRRGRLGRRLAGWLAGLFRPGCRRVDYNFAIDCPQLVSLRLHSADRLSDLCAIIRQTVLPNRQLMAEGGKVQIISQLLLDTSVPRRSLLDTEALGHITHLWVEHQYEDGPLLRLLPKLKGLQEIKLFLLDFEEGKRQPAVFRALAALPHLHSVLLDARDSRFGTGLGSFPLILTTPLQLVNVTSLAIIYSSAFHRSLVDKQQLLAVFPRLATFRVTYVVNVCRVCRYIVSPSSVAGTPAGARAEAATGFSYGRLFEFFSRGLKVMDDEDRQQVERYIKPCLTVLTSDLAALRVEPHQMEVRFLGPSMRTIPFLAYNAVKKTVEMV